MYALIQTAGDFGNYVKEYGWPFVGLVVATLLIWKVLIPLVREQNERIIKLMEDQLNEAREARTQEVSKFVKTIDETIGRYTEAQHRSTEAVNELIQEQRKKRDPRHQ